MSKQGTPKIQTNVYQTVIYENSTGCYVCKAPTYALAGSALWQIKFIDMTSSNYTQIKWCDGDRNFDNKASDYLILNY